MLVLCVKEDLSCKLRQGVIYFMDFEVSISYYFFSVHMGGNSAEPFKWRNTFSGCRKVKESNRA